MFVRRTQTRRSDSGETYHTHRLVRSERVGGKVRQRTLLNLGRHFDIERERWPLLCVRVGEALSGQQGLDVAEAAILQVPRHAAKFAFRDVQPAAVFRRVAELDAPHQRARPGRLEHFVEGVPWCAC